MKIDSNKIDGHQMHDFLSSVISPRPIALISTIGEDGIYNAAPYSAVTPVSFKPPVICVSSGLRRGQKKDTVKNIEYSQDFVINFMGESHIAPAIKASAAYPSDVDEIKAVGLTAAKADRVSSPRISEAQISLECQLVRTLEFGSGEDFRTVIFGEVLLFHVKDKIWAGRNIDPSLYKAVGRLGPGMYCRSTDIFKM